MNFFHFRLCFLSDNFAHWESHWVVYISHSLVLASQRGSQWKNPPLMPNLGPPAFLYPRCQLLSVWDHPMLLFSPPNLLHHLHCESCIQTLPETDLEGSGPSLSLLLHSSLNQRLLEFGGFSDTPKGIWLTSLSLKLFLPLLILKEKE